MGEARRKRPKKTEAATVDKLIDGQQPAPLVKQGDIPAHLNVFATMEAAWLELAQDLYGDLPQKQREDAKFIFFHGVQAAANLMIYCAGQGNFELAADRKSTRLNSS